MLPFVRQTDGGSSRCCAGCRRRRRRCHWQQLGGLRSYCTHCMPPLLTRSAEGSACSWREAARALTAICLAFCSQAARGWYQDSHACTMANGRAPLCTSVRSLGAGMSHGSPARTSLSATMMTGRVEHNSSPGTGAGSQGGGQAACARSGSGHHAARNCPAMLPEHRSCSSTGAGCNEMTALWGQADRRGGNGQPRAAEGKTEGGRPPNPHQQARVETMPQSSMWPYRV